MKRCLCLLLVLVAIPADAKSIEVVDSDGTEVNDYQVMWHTADNGYSRWSDGRRLSLPRNADVVDVIVRSDGFASTVSRFTSDSLRNLRAGTATVVLRRGEEVQLELNVPDGMDVPDDFLPQLYFEEFASRVRMMWQPVNLRKKAVKPDFNMLNVRKVADGRYTFRLSGENPPFFVAFHHPGWLQFYEVGPLSGHDVTDQVIELKVPRPSTLRILLATAGEIEGQLPFTDANIDVYWPNPDMDGSFYEVTWNERIKPAEERILNDLGPGEYMVSINTSPKDGVTNIEGGEINPGSFFARQVVSLAPGKSKLVRIDWMPFDPEAVRGNSHARLTLRRPDGSLAADVPVCVEWFDGHYGTIQVYDGHTSNKGVVELHGISPNVATELPYGPYSVKVDGETVGWFRLERQATVQEFEFRMTPEVGDLAPDINMSEVDSDTVHKLSDYRGQVVFLELWATWCGPCQPAMEKLNDLASAKPEWTGKVAIIPLSVDKAADSAAEHVADRGWTAVRHFWSPPFDEGQSEAEHALNVRGIPTAFLLNRDGTIAWRGHPTVETDGGVTLPERIEKMLTDE